MNKKAEDLRQVTAVATFITKSLFECVDEIPMPRQKCALKLISQTIHFEYHSDKPHLPSGEFAMSG
jgi:hypothetical protein